MKTFSKGRMPSACHNAGTMRRKLLPILVAGCFGAGSASANPVGPQVVNGQASFASQGNTLAITNSPGAIINWQSFSINQGEVTRFIQQNAGSAVLNRITGQDPSQILGALQSNGRVFLINPNGILFGQGAQIDVNGLVASTLNISNEDFLAGRLHFAAGSQAGDLKNQGTINTPSGGRVYLIAPNVENSGIITSPQGEVMLAAGRSVQLVDSADPDLQVVVSAPDDRALNLGSVIAQGGKAGIYGALINQRGIVNADSAVVGENGKIVFKASRDTVLEAGSRTSATGAGQGGEIHVLGQRVALTGNAAVDASGKAGGGTVLIGGDYQGRNAALPNAQRSYVGADVTIDADATDAGNGGKVVVWSDQSTQAYGAISVRGGPRAGHGGLVETSGHHLDIAGLRVDAGAAHGASGDWLLDPYDIEVTNGGSYPATAFQNFTDPPSTGVSQVSAGAISTSSASVMLQATHDITFVDPISISTPGVGLTAQAGNNINVNNSINTFNSSIVLRANDPGGPASGSGVLSVNSIVNSHDGNIVLSGASVNFGTAASVAAGASVVTVTATANGGTIGMTAGSSISSTVGQINLAADDMSLAGSLSVGTGAVALAPATAGRAIDLGTDTAGKLGLTSAELGTINAGKAVIGNTSSGAINVSAPLMSNLGSLSLISGGTITQAPGAWLGGGLSLRLEGSAVTLLEANPTGVIAGSTTSGDFQYHSMNGIAVSLVDGASGITVPGSANIKLISDQNINQSDPLIGGGLGLKAKSGVFLMSPGNNVGNVVADLYQGGAGSGDMMLFNSGNLTVGSGMVVDGSTVSGITTNNMSVNLMTGPYQTLAINGPISTGTGTNGHVDLQADKLALNSTITTNVASIQPFSANRPITVGLTACNVVDPGDGSCLAVTQLGNVAAQTIGIGRDSTLNVVTAPTSNTQTGPNLSVNTTGPNTFPANTAGPIYVEGITSGVSSLTDRNAITTRIGLLSGAGVSQGGALGIDVQDLGAIAGGAGSVNLTNAGNKITNLAGATTGGNFSVVDSINLNVATLSGGATANSSGYSVPGIQAGSGYVSLTSSGAISGGSITAGGLTATAGGGIMLSTNVGSLTASNSGMASSIFIANNLVAGSNPLLLQGATQVGTGDITISNIGHLKVVGPVSADSGSVMLSSASPLTVNSTVSSTSDDVVLYAGASGVPGSGDTLTIGTGGVVKAGLTVVLAAGDGIVVSDPTKIGSGSGQIVQLPNLNVTGVNPCLANGSPADCLVPVSKTVASDPVVEAAASVAEDTVVSTTTSVVASATTPSTGNTTIGTATSTVTEREGASDNEAASPTPDGKTVDGKKDEKKEEKKDEKKDAVVTKDSGAKKNEPAKKMYCN